MVVDLLPRDPIGLVLVDLGVQEPRIADHAAGVEGHFEGEGQFEFARRKIPRPTGEDFPEEVPPEVARASLVRAGPREDPDIVRRRVDLEHVEGEVGAL